MTPVLSFLIAGMALPMAYGQRWISFAGTGNDAVTNANEGLAASFKNHKDFHWHQWPFL